MITYRVCPFSRPYFRIILVNWPYFLITDNKLLRISEQYIQDTISQYDLFWPLNTTENDLLRLILLSQILYWSQIMTWEENVENENHGIMADMQKWI